jgi:hypothetical protein
MIVMGWYDGQLAHMPARQVRVIDHHVILETHAARHRFAYPAHTPHTPQHESLEARTALVTRKSFPKMINPPFLSPN